MPRKPRRARSIFSYSRRRVEGSVQSMVVAGMWFAYEGGGGVLGWGFVCAGGGKVGRLVERSGCGCGDERAVKTSRWREEKARTDWRRWRPFGTVVRVGHVVGLLGRVRRLGRGWAAGCGLGSRVGWLGFVVTRWEDEVEGWSDGAVRFSCLEDEAEGTWVVGAVELRLVEGLVEALVEGPWEVVGGEVDCTAVTLWFRLPLGDVFGALRSLRFLGALRESGFGESCSCAVRKLASDDIEGELPAVSAANRCSSSSILSSRGFRGICCMLLAGPCIPLGGVFEMVVSRWVASAPPASLSSGNECILSELISMACITFSICSRQSWMIDRKVFVGRVSDQRRSNKLLMLF
ncbi:hypothetical protein BDR22DRAFT_850455 [Usnea florida]